MRIDPAKWDGMLAALPEAMERLHVPGAAVTALKGGERSATGLLGLADAERNTPVTERTWFQAASLTKPVFAYLVLRKAEAGLLDLHRPLRDYGVQPPSLEPAAQRITAAHVLTHGCGLPNWGKHPLPLRFAPGEGYGYSGEGYAYLQRVLEHLTGRRLDHLLQEEVFDRFGMEDAVMIWTGALRRDSAQPYDREGKPEEARRHARHNAGYEPNAAFSLYVNINEYPKFLAGLLEEGFADRIKAVVNPAAFDVRWGLGWGLYHDFLWHWGDNDGFKSFVCWDPVSRDALLLHCNGYNALELCYDAVEALTGEELSGIRSFVTGAE